MDEPPRVFRMQFPVFRNVTAPSGIVRASHPALVPMLIVFAVKFVVMNRYYDQ